MRWQSISKWFHRITTVGRPSINRREDSTWVGAIGVTVLSSLLVITGGTIGMLLSVIVAIVWWFLPPPYVLAVGHLGLLVILPGDSLFAGESAIRLGAVELGMFIVLLETAPTLDDPLRYISVLCIVAAILFEIVLLGVAWTDAVWTSGIALMSVSAFIAYGLHRYELVQLGLVGADQS